MFESLLVLSAYYQLTTPNAEPHLRALSAPTACPSCEADIVLPPVLPSLRSVDGLLLTGPIKKKNLNAVYVFRPWISAASCDSSEKVKGLAIPVGARDYVYRVITDESEAVQSADGRTLYWSLLLAEDGSSVTYKNGINDLWAQVVSIDKTTCASLVTAEH